MGRLRVAFFTAYPPSRGRLSEYAVEVVSWLRRLGVDVWVLSDSGPSGPGVVRVWGFNRLVNPLRVFRVLARLRPHVLHFNIHFAVFGRGRLINFLGFVGVFLSMLLARLLSVKSLVSLHNLPEAVDVESYGVRRSLLNRLGFFVAERLVTLRCLGGVAVTLDVYKRILGGRFGCRVYCVPHGAWLLGGGGGDGSGRRLILFIGYVSPGKDLELLYEAFRSLRDGREELELVVVGSPNPSFEREGREQLRRLVGRPGVRVLGYLSLGKLARVLRMARCVVLPYKTPAGASGVLHLASGAGIPVVATDSPEFRELRRRGAVVFLVERRPESIAEAVSSLMRDHVWGELSSRALEYARRNSWASVARRYVGVYADLLGLNGS